MGGPGRLPRQAHAVQQTGHRPQPIGHGPALFDVGRDVDQPIAAHAVHVRVRSGKHPCPQFFLPRWAQLPRPSRPRAVAQPGQTLGVEAHHRVAQRLALPPDKAGRFRPAHSLQRLRNPQRPQGCATVRLTLRKPAQVGCAHIIPDHQATRAHPPSPLEHAGREAHFSHATDHGVVQSRVTHEAGLALAGWMVAPSAFQWWCIWTEVLAQQQGCRRATARTWPFRHWQDRRRSATWRPGTG